MYLSQSTYFHLSLKFSFTLELFNRRKLRTYCPSLQNIRIFFAPAFFFRLRRTWMDWGITRKHMEKHTLNSAIAHERRALTETRAIYVSPKITSRWPPQNYDEAESQSLPNPMFRNSSYKPRYRQHNSPVPNKLAVAASESTKGCIGSRNFIRLCTQWWTLFATRAWHIDRRRVIESRRGEWM